MPSPYTLPSLDSIRSANINKVRNPKIPALPSQTMAVQETSDKRPKALFDGSPEIVDGKRRGKRSANFAQLDEENEKRKTARVKRDARTKHTPVLLSTEQNAATPEDEVEEMEVEDEMEEKPKPCHQLVPFNPTFNNFQGLNVSPPTLVAPAPLTAISNITTPVAPTPVTAISQIVPASSHAVSYTGRVAVPIINNPIDDVFNGSLTSLSSHTTHSHSPSISSHTTPSAGTATSLTSTGAAPTPGSTSPGTPPSVAPRKVRKRKPCISDFDIETAYLLKIAAEDFKAYVCAAAPFTSEVTVRHNMANECWVRANGRAFPDSPVAELTEDARKTILQRDSQIRGAIRDRILPHIQKTYNLNDGLGARGRNVNRFMVHCLRLKAGFTCEALKLPNGFTIPKGWESHISDPDLDEDLFGRRVGFYKNPFLQEAINISFFRDSFDLGVKFKEWFNPISLETFALIITIIDHCIGEYKTGVRIPAKLTGALLTESFNGHLADLISFDEENSRRSLKLRKKLFKRGWRHSAAVNEIPELPPARISAEDFGEDSDNDYSGISSDEEQDDEE